MSLCSDPELLVSMPTFLRLILSARTVVARMAVMTVIGLDKEGSSSCETHVINN